MRLLPWLVLAISLSWTSNAQARLFWQTYGSTVPAAEGCGCTWNWNQDYFVPRHSTSGRYGLYSPCKTSCSNSAACRSCHPFYPGYCNIYGPCHYRRRDHVYAAYCGCTPLRIGYRQCGGCAATSHCTRGHCGIQASCHGPGVQEHHEAVLHNVEGSQFETLGSIPIEGGDLLTRTDMTQLGGDRGGQLLLQPRDSNSLLQGLPSLGLPLPPPQN